MRDAFPGYYPPSPEDFGEYWGSSIIVLDSSSLLNLFQYSVHTTQQILEVLSAKHDQLWIPFHVGLEFHRGRGNVIARQSGAFKKIENTVESAHNTIESAINEFKKHPSLGADELLDAVKKSRKKWKRLVRKARAEHDDVVVAASVHNETFRKISELYAGRVGKPWDETQHDDILKEGEERYASKTPPGYMDDKKANDLRLGDLIIWKQIIEKAKSDSRHVLFVTDDVKEDWWGEVDGRRVARPELVEEFVDEADGQLVAFLTSDRFLNLAKSQGVEIGEGTVEEVEEVSSKHAQRESENSVLHSMDSVEREVLAERLSSIREAMARFATDRAEARSAISGMSEALATYAAAAEQARVGTSSTRDLLSAYGDALRQYAEVRSHLGRADELRRAFETAQSAVYGTPARPKTSREFLTETRRANSDPVREREAARLAAEVAASERVAAEAENAGGEASESESEHNGEN